MKKKIINLCLYCGKETTNKEFCSAKCRGMFNGTYSESNWNYTRNRAGVNRISRRA